MPGRRASRSGSPLCGGPATALRLTVRALATVDERRAGLVAIGPLSNYALFKALWITPDIQLYFDPALHPGSGPAAVVTIRTTALF